MSIKEKVLEFLKDKGIKGIVFKQIIEIYADLGNGILFQIQRTTAEYPITTEEFAEAVEKGRELELKVDISLEPIREKFIEKQEE